MRGIAVMTHLNRKLHAMGSPRSYGLRGEGSPWALREHKGSNGEIIKCEIVRIHGAEVLHTFAKRRAAKKHLARMILRIHTNGEGK